MNLKQFGWVIAAGFLSLHSQQALAQIFTQSELQYQSRGDRWEGVKPKPISGFNVEVISVMVDYNEPNEMFPPRLTVKFFLEKPTQAYLTVRERDYKFFYWMDQVKPSSHWRPGFNNEFVWQTASVLSTLAGSGLKLDDLGVIVRLEGNSVSAIERVAPALLYHSHPPKKVEGYVFTMKTSSDSNLRYSIRREGEAQAVWTQPFRRARGGRPFAIQWDASKQEEGHYQLEVSGYALDNNDAVSQIVRFYHRPAVE